MQCFHCRYPDSRVVDTWDDATRNMIKRRRECLKCGMRFSTEEKMRDLIGKGTHESPPSPQ